MGRNGSGPNGAERLRIKRLDAALTSYIIAQGGDGLERNLEGLGAYLESSGILEADRERLLGLLNTARSKMEEQNEQERMKARLFTRESRPRAKRYRRGSDFCVNPACGMFKNYEKECPYCGHVEWRLG